MSHNTRQYSRSGTDLQALPLTSENDLLAQGDTLKIIACPVCRAVYVPSNEQRNHSSTLLLETAFLEVCHFCFRCQRPACPQCWNPVHHACAACCEEARLPFRGPVPALEGLAFLPLSAHPARGQAISFICQRNGRFYTPDPAPHKIATTTAPVSVPAAASMTSETATSRALPLSQSAPDGSSHATTSAYPGWLQEVMGQKPAGICSASSPASLSTDRPAETVHADSPPASAPVSWSQTNWPHMTPAESPSAPSLAPGQPVEPVEPAKPAEILETAEQPLPASERQGEATEIQAQESGEEISPFERIENILIVLTSILLLAVVLMIVLSLCFARVNTFFLTLIHIDIRTEIAYLLQLK
jgi:hypothetical protein